MTDEKGRVSEVYNKMIQPYCIKNWEDVFEKSQTRKAKTHHWVAMPIKHDGAGFRRISIQPNSCELFCAWCLIVQVAAKCHVRGVLADDDGKAFDAEDLAVKTGFPPRIFDDAFEFFSSEKIGWLTTSETQNTTSETEEKEHATSETQSATSETQNTTSGETHSTVQYNTRQTHTEEVVVDKFPEYRLIKDCNPLSSITPERYVEIRRSFPDLKDASKVVSLACLKATSPEAKIKSADWWLIDQFKRAETAEKKPALRPIQRVKSC